MYDLSLDKLRDFHAGVLEQADKLIARTKEANRDFNEDELKSYNDLVAQANRACARMQTLQQHEERMADWKKQAQSQRQVPPSKEVEEPLNNRDDPYADPVRLKTRALQLWLRGSHEDDDLALLKRAGINPHSREITVNFDTRATLTTATATATLTPQTFLNEFEESRKYFSTIRPVARVIPTATGETLVLPSFDDTSNVGAIVSENASIFTDANPSFTNISLGAYKFSSKKVPISRELLNDSVFNFESELARLLGERIGRKENQVFTYGTGTGEPYGIVTGATNSGLTTPASSISMDTMMALPFKVDLAYRASGKFMFHDATALYLKQLKDGINRYFVDPENPAIITFLGYPVVLNNDMAQIGTGNKSVLFGDLSKYHIRDVGGQMVFKRLEEIRAEYDEVVFIAMTRADGRLRDAGANPVKYLIHS